MTRSEKEVSIEQRYLWLEGKASVSSMGLIDAGLPAINDSSTLTFFVGYSYVIKIDSEVRLLKNSIAIIKI